MSMARKIVFPKIISIAALLLHFSMGAQASVLMQTGFENQESGSPMVRTLWTEEGFQPADWDQGLESRTQVDGKIAAQGIHSLRVMYPKDEFGPEYTGCQISLRFPSHDELYASYYLRFSENFSWGTSHYGGKLPGLAGGGNCSGGKDCDGTNGWSARFMWRADGKLILYLYDMLKPETFGLDVPLFYPDGTLVVAERGKWYHITERVKMNSSPDKADGEVQAWVNGEEVLFLTGRKFTTCDVKIDNFYISTFHGGDDETWCPTDTCYTFLDNVMIGTTYEDVCYTSCRKPDAGPDQSLCAVGTAKFLVDLPQEYSLRWMKEGKMEAEGGEFSTSTVGRYIVVADSGRCSQNDTVNVFENLNVTLPKDLHICQTSFVSLDTRLSDGASLLFQWYKDGNPIDGALHPVLTVKDAGLYSVEVSSPNCGSATDSVVVTSGLLRVDDVSGRAGDRVDLSVQGEGLYQWRDAGGELLGEGALLTIPLPQGESYLYVEDASGFDGTVGKKQLSENAWTRNNFSKEYMQFVVERTLSIDSISIYPTQALDATLNIVDEESNVTLFSRTYKGLKGGEEARLPLGVELKAGRYHIDAYGTTASLYHSHTDGDIHFPYKVEGLISLTGCNLEWINNKGWYMLFYNWHVSAGNYCAAAPVKLTGSSTNSVDAILKDQMEVYWLDGQIVVKNIPLGKKVTVMNLSGREVASCVADATTLFFNTESWPKGVYVVDGVKVRVE